MASVGPRICAGADGDAWSVAFSDNVRLSLTADKQFKLDSGPGSLTEQEVDDLARTFLSLHTALYRKRVFPLKGVFSYKGNPSFPRDSVEAFIANVSSVVPPGSRCLEWGVQYSNVIPGCTEKWSFEYDPNNPRVDTARRHIYGAVDRRLPRPLQEVAGTFDAVICTQVFEHIRYPHVAAKTISALLKGGGHLLWSAPFMEPMHKVPEDHFRYTLEGGEQLLTDVGLVVRRSFVGGSAMLTSARILGYQRKHFGPEVDKDMLLDAAEYKRRRVPVRSDVYWGIYLLVEKAKTRRDTLTRH